jgi:uncharacterized protein YwbE
MKIFNFFKKNKELLTEALPSYKNKGKQGFSDTYLKNTRGEGYSDISFITGYGKNSVNSFNNFYNNYINIEFDNKLHRINYYRIMADMPEISAIIEDIITESTIVDEHGNSISLEIIDDELKANQNIVKNLEDEFHELFYKNLDINILIERLLNVFYVDGELFFEKVINKAKPSQGLLNINILPTETMDILYDTKTGKVEAYLQYLEKKAKKPSTIEEALEDDKIVVFYPSQISHLVYSKCNGVTLGYLDKAKQPFNQLKLLETSVIIYRLVRAPERLVFKIDTGSMPRDKAMKFVEKIKQKLSQKVSYDTSTGELDNQPDVISMLDNYFLPQCLRLNTKISCLDGSDKTLSEMIDDFNKGIKNEVLSVDQQTGKIIKGEVEWAGITRRNAELIRVHLDNGEFVDVTPDHKFVMRDGSEVEAQNLKHNDSLMPYYTVDFIEKLDFKEDTGCLTIKDAGNNHNFLLSTGVFVKNSADGRGSSIESVGGNPSGFSEMDDIYYFSRKLYTALRYPMSRVFNMQEGRSADTLFMNGNSTEINRDEIRWAKFLEGNQNKFSNEFKSIFLLHLEFKGLKKEYELDNYKIKIRLTPPNNYKDQMDQAKLEMMANNYQNFANNSEFSKSFLLMKYMNYTEEDLKANSEGFALDKKYLPKDDGY